MRNGILPSAFYALSAVLAAPACGQVKADLGAPLSEGIGSAGSAVVVPLNGAAAVVPLNASNLAPLSAPAPVLSAVPVLPAALAAPAQPAALVLPAAAAPVQSPPAAIWAAGNSAALPAEVRPGGKAGIRTGGADAGAGAEGDWKSGAALFDNFLDGAEVSAAAVPAGPSGRAAPLSAWSARAGSTQEGSAYARAVKAASGAGWTGRGGPVLDAAAAFLSAQGVKFERAPIGGSDGLRVAPERGLTSLNDFAADAKESLGVDVAYLPERTRDAVAAFNGGQRLLMVANFDRPDFFMGAIHEARHAWYSALLRRGDIRLFHLQAVARPGRSVAPDAEVYARYLSLEELSTFPKTLKHMITEAAKLDGAAAEYLSDRTAVRGRQFMDILRSAAYLSDQIERLDRVGKLKPRRMTDKEAAAVGLEAAEGIDYFALELPQATLYIPVLKRETRRFGVKVVRGSQDEAAAGFRLRAKLLGALVLAVAPSTKVYLEAARAGDWVAAGNAADKLVAAVREAEAAWPSERP